MRIVAFSPRFSPVKGGAETYLAEVSHRLVQSGHQCHVITTNANSFEYFWDPQQTSFSAPDAVDGKLIIQRFPVTHLPASSLAYRGVRRLLWLLNYAPFPTTIASKLSQLTPRVPTLHAWSDTSHQPADVVFGVNIAYESLLAAGQRYARRQGCPFIAFPFTHLGAGPAPGQDKLSRFYTMDHQIETLLASDGIVALNNAERDFYIGHGYDPKRIIVAPPAIEPLSSTMSEEAARHHIAERFNQPALLKNPIILSLTTHSVDKGSPFLVGASRSFLSWDEEVELVLAGNVVARVERFLNGLTPYERQHLHVVGQVSDEDKEALLAACTAFAMPSRIDSFGIVYLEAWAHKKPVIGAEAWGIQNDVIHHEVDGLLVPFGDISKLADAMARLVHDKEVATTLGQKGYENLATRYNWDITMTRIEQLISDVTTNRPVSPQ